MIERERGGRSGWGGGGEKKGVGQRSWRGRGRRGAGGRWRQRYFASNAGTRPNGAKKLGFHSLERKSSPVPTKTGEKKNSRTLEA